jgi:hypothetical protein
MDASSERRIDFPPILHAQFQRVSIDYIKAQNTKYKDKVLFELKNEFPRIRDDSAFGKVPS